MLPTYRSDLRIPITNIFDVFSIYFGGPFPRTKAGNRFALVAVEHLTGWPLAVPTKNATTDVVIDFMEKEVIFQFDPQRVIVSDNATCFTSRALTDFMKAHSITWKTVLAYAPISNSRAERMVGTLKRSILKTVLSSGLQWDDALHQVVHGYRRRHLAGSYSPFELMYGTPPRMMPSDVGALLPTSTIQNREAEVLALVSARAGRVIPNTSDGVHRKSILAENPE